MENMPVFCEQCPLLRAKSVDAKEVLPILGKRVNTTKSNLPNLVFIFSEEIQTESLNLVYDSIAKEHSIISSFESILFVPLTKCLNSNSENVVQYCAYHSPMSKYFGNSVTIVLGSSATKNILKVFSMFHVPEEQPKNNFSMYGAGFVPSIFTKNQSLLTKKQTKTKKSNVESSAYLLQEELFGGNVSNPFKFDDSEIKKVVLVFSPTIQQISNLMGSTKSENGNVFTRVVNTAREIYDKITISRDKMFFEVEGLFHTTNQTYLTSIEQILPHLNYLIKNPRVNFAIDAETLIKPTHLGKEWYLPTSDFASISMAYTDPFGKKIAFSFPFSLPSINLPIEDKSIIKEKIKYILESRGESDGYIIGHNLRFDLKWLVSVFEIDYKKFYFNKIQFYDTMDMAFLLNDNLSPDNASLEDLCVSLCGYREWKGNVEKWNKIYADEKSTKEQRAKEDIELLKYSSIDAEATYDLFLYQQNEFSKDRNVRLSSEYFPLYIRNIFALEYQGLFLDLSKVESTNKMLLKSRQECLDKLFTDIENYSNNKYNAENFNLNSSQQMTQFLTEFLKIKLVDKSEKTEKFLFNDDVVSVLLKKQLPPSIREFLEAYSNFKSYDKMLTTFVKDYVNRNVNGIIFPSIQLVGTKTGRTSAKNPNIQNIPNMFGMKQIFVPRDKDRYIVYADYSQAEVRMLAMLSQDQSFLNIFKHGVDPYKQMASTVYKISPENVSSELRQQMKQVVLGLNYGMSAVGLADKLGVDKSQAESVLHDFFKTFNRIQPYREKLFKYCAKNGFIIGGTLKKRRFPMFMLIDDESERLKLASGKYKRYIMNSPIQSSSSDLAIYNFSRINEHFIQNNIDAYFIATIHDAVIFDVHKKDVLYAIKIFQEYLPQLHPLLETYMNSVYKNGYVVPEFTCEVLIGKNWDKYDSVKNPYGLKEVIGIENNKLVFKEKNK